MLGELLLILLGITPAHAQATSQAQGLFWATPCSTTGYLGLRGICASDISGLSFTLSQMPTLGANSTYVNATAGSAVPTSQALPSCSTAASALLYTTNTGFSCNTSITAAAAPVAGLTGTGTGVLAALAVNTGATGGFPPVSGTPTSGQTAQWGASGVLAGVTQCPPNTTVYYNLAGTSGTYTTPTCASTGALATQLEVEFAGAGGA